MQASCAAARGGEGRGVRAAREDAARREGIQPKSRARATTSRRSVLAHRPRRAHGTVARQIKFQAATGKGSSASEARAGAVKAISIRKRLQMSVEFAPQGRMVGREDIACRAEEGRA